MHWIRTPTTSRLPMSVMASGMFQLRAYVLPPFCQKRHVELECTRATLVQAYVSLHLPAAVVCTADLLIPRGGFQSARVHLVGS